MEEQFGRTIRLIGQDNENKLHNTKVAVFGVGGVGSFVVEALTRIGIGEFILVDKDEIDITNLNRQIHATYETIGQPKVEVMKKRMLSINPNVKVTTYQEFYLPGQDIVKLDNSIDYIVDAIDTVTAKLDLIEKANNLNIPIISSMGTGNKLDPTRLELTDISKTSICPLAKVIRKELKKRGITKLKVVYSKEEPIKVESMVSEDGKRVKQSPGSVSFVPSAAGLIIASAIVRDIINK